MRATYIACVSSWKTHKRLIIMFPAEEVSKSGHSRDGIVAKHVLHSMAAGVSSGKNRSTEPVLFSWHPQPSRRKRFYRHRDLRYPCLPRRIHEVDHLTVLHRPVGVNHH